VAAWLNINRYEPTAAKTKMIDIYR